MCLQNNFFTRSCFIRRTAGLVHKAAKPPYPLLPTSTIGCCQVKKKPRMVGMTVTLLSSSLVQLLDEVEQNIIICQGRADQLFQCRSRRLRQIIGRRDTDKSRYLSITEFNNCFIIPSLSLCLCFNHFLAVQGSDQPFSLENVVPITHEQNIICSKTRLDSIHEQTISYVVPFGFF